MNEIVSWLRQRATAATARGFVVGLSGGIDSAVVARLCQLATPGQVAGVIMPCRSDPQDEADAGLVADAFSLPVIRVDLETASEALMTDARAALDTLPREQRPAAEGEAGRVARGNVGPRLRMATLYYVANSLGYLVAGTGNRSELTIGYFTKYGDGGADILPLARLLKSEVRAIARELQVPAEIIDKPPSAGLWLGQTDEGEMGFTYAELERYLVEGPASVSPQLAERIDKLARGSEHKRAMPPMPPK